MYGRELIVPTLQWKIHGENFMQNLWNSRIATLTESKVKPMAALRHSYCHPASQHWDACAPLSLVQEKPHKRGHGTKVPQ